MLRALLFQTRQLSFTLKRGSGVAPLIHDIIYWFILAARQSIFIYFRMYSMNGALTTARTLPFFHLVTRPGRRGSRNETGTRHTTVCDTMKETNPRKGAIFAKRDITTREKLGGTARRVVLVASNELASRFTRDLRH